MNKKEGKEMRKTVRSLEKQLQVLQEQQNQLLAYLQEAASEKKAKGKKGEATFSGRSHPAGKQRREL